MKNTIGIPLRQTTPVELAANQQASRILEENVRLKREAAIRVPWIVGQDFGVVLAFCPQDAWLLIENLRWMAELDTLKLYPCLVAYPARTDPRLVRLVVESAACFHHVEQFPAPFDLPDERWPVGVNYTFGRVALRMRDQKRDFLFLEPDCTPLRAGWLDEIQREYRGCGFPFMGCVESAGEGYPAHIAGNAVYNWAVAERFSWTELGRAWDVAMANYILPRAHATKLIHQEFFRDGKIPTFESTNDLGRIPKEAALHHRCKDGSLIRQLKLAR